MKGLLQRRLCVVLAAAAAAGGAWWQLPGTVADEASFKAVAGSFVNPPLIVAGRGSQEDPWTLKGLSADPRTDKLQAPVVVSVGDDVEGFFQSSPPDPIDYAVIFSNFQRLGSRKAATGVVFAWESPDPIGLAALEKSLGKFDSLVMAAPLSRGAVGTALPPAFRRASVAVDSVRGDTALLPVVNRIPIPGVVLGDDNTAAGFSVLESEAGPTSTLLFARWDDRVVFSFPLLAVLQRFNLPAQQVEIRLGEYAKLSPRGPMVPIDRYGRLDLPVKSLKPYAEIPADALIDGGDDLFPKQAPDPLILRDDRSSADTATRAFSKEMSGIVATLASDDAFTRQIPYPRLPVPWELSLIGGMAALLAAFCGLPAFPRLVSGLCLAGSAAAAQWIAFASGQVWLPGAALLAAIAAALLVAPLIRIKRPPPAPLVLPEIFLPSKPPLVLPEIELPTPPPGAAPFSRKARRKSKSRHGRPASDP